MGSCLSGRRSERPIVEDCLTLDIAWLMRLGPIREGNAGNGEVAWSNNGQRIGAIQFRLDLRQVDRAFLALDYGITSPNRPRRTICQKIELLSTTPHFGGKLWWMRCPITGGKVRILHLPPGEEKFASRKAWGLAYRVERISHFDRPFEKLFRLQRKLVGQEGWGVLPMRPRGMWQQTHARHLEHFAALDEACAREAMALID